MSAWIATWAGLALVTLLALHRLRDFPYQLSWIEAWEGIRPLLAHTLWAAIKVWLFWGWTAAVIGGFALRLDPEIEQFDALLLGAGGAWVLAYLLGNLLGPIGLFNGPTLWGLLVLGSAILWRDPPRLERRPASSGQKLAAIALALLAVSYLPLQLGSPVVPFMDVLSYPASAQRVVTFGTYAPFNNDPYGCWGPYAQTPALELFYAMLALGTHTYRAALAESAAMLPMAALMIFATWRVGKMMFDDASGGAAALLLFFTCLFRRAQGMRGTAVDFALVGLALAFFMSRRRLLFAAGALILGTAVASHAIDGAFAMMVAGVGAMLALAEADFRRFGACALALAGALMVAAPELLIGLARPVPYPVVPLIQLAGIGTIVLAATFTSSEAAQAEGGWLVTSANRWIIGFFILAVLYRHATQPYSIYQEISDNLPMLTLFCFGGLIAVFGTARRANCSRYAGLAAAALLLGVGGEYLDPLLRAWSHNPSTGMMASDVGIKLWDYWCPYFLTLPAGFIFGLAYERFSRPATLFVLLALLIYPWHQIKDPVDYDSVEHSVTEHWGFNLHTAAIGYWAGHTDRRWTFTPEEMGLVKVLDDEVAAGRITPATHILHLCESISSWTMVQFSVLTGINDDPIEVQHDPNNLWEGGSRVRGMNQLVAALAQHPPYILEQIPAPAWVGYPPPGYERIFEFGPVRLYRRLDLATVSNPPGRAAAVLWIPGLLALGLALFIAVRKGGEAENELIPGSSAAPE